MPEGDHHVKVVFVRHGETDANVLGITQGWGDGPTNQLNATGRAQAREIAAQLWREHPTISCIYTADNGRSFETGIAIVDTFNSGGSAVPIERLRAFNEICHGDADGIPHADRAAMKRAFYMEGAPYPNGEDIFDLDARLSSGLRRILSATPDRRTIGVVSSKGVLKRLLGNAANWSREEAHDKSLPNCVVFWICYAVNPVTGAFRPSRYSAPGDGHDARIAPAFARASSRA